MVKVPTYTPDVSTRPIFQQDVNVRGTPDAFGAGIGRGMQSAARGLGQVSDAMAQVQALEDEANVRRARNDYLRDKDALQYDPERGYLQQQGKDAIDGFTNYTRDLGSLRKKHIKNLTPNQQRMFSQAVEPLEIDARRTGLIHKGNASKAFIVDELKAGTQTFADQALLHYRDPQLRSR